MRSLLLAFMVAFTLFTVFTVYTVFFDGAGWLFKCLNLYVNLRNLNGVVMIAQLFCYCKPNCRPPKGRLPCPVPAKQGIAGTGGTM
jgi:hypothetical protein